MSPTVLWRRLTTPTTDGDLARRQEAVLLNVLAGFGVLSLVTQAAQLAKLATGAGLAEVGWWAINVAFFAVLFLLMRQARRGRLRLAAAILIGILGLLALAVLLSGGIANPMWSLVLGLCVVLSTILLSGRTGLAVAAIGGAVALTIAFLTEAGSFEPLADPGPSGTIMADALGIFAVLGFLAAVCVLYVRDVGTSIDQILTNGAADSPLRQLRTSGLSVREIEVVQLIADGLKNDEIASRLFLSPRTVQSHVANAMGKTECANRTALGVLAVREGLVPLVDGTDP